MTSRLDELNKKLQTNTSQGLASRNSSSSPSSLRPPVNPSLRPPPSASGANRGLFPPLNSVQRASSASQARKKVHLKPGHSPLDWARINRTEPQYKLRGVAPNTPPPQYVRIDKDELKKHRTRDDCWTCINGKVFNITPYVDFHPGGVDEIMKCAGRDGTALFNKYHSWVNADRMLENCIVGVFTKD
ncbi:Cytochrome b5 reductase 4 [Candida viswanathii]|uniref:Cytochrome b5 reductase 4 n=1 Tax=Candida viswanathii TaxID=5486 RepID=A0A367Y7C9_9ASCO|nr:Cytochrome b5 reductase 4 [Candida viswanathii]